MGNYVVYRPDQVVVEADSGKSPHSGANPLDQFKSDLEYINYLKASAKLTKEEDYDTKQFEQDDL